MSHNPLEQFERTGRTLVDLNRKQDLRQHLNPSLLSFSSPVSIPYICIVHPSLSIAFLLSCPRPSYHYNPGLQSMLHSVGSQTQRSPFSSVPRGCFCRICFPRVTLLIVKKISFSLTRSVLVCSLVGEGIRGRWPDGWKEQTQTGEKE